ncbi:MAG: hypothetical protein HY921_08995 [Elusimicrobia bacterium]|nr:hypothetical protein [Elusimicrobiota bacterium]
MGLSEDQKRSFFSRGHIALENCFSKDAARKFIDRAYQRLGYDPKDPNTWKEERSFLPGESSVVVADFAPRAWEAICALVGGAERVVHGSAHTWSDCFIVKFPSRDPAGENRGDMNWHLDGSHEPRFLDTAEMGLLTFVLWSDAGPGSGGTRIACDSVGRVARCLLEHPEGVVKTEIPINEIVGECRDFVELTGRAGTVVLAHPYLLHCETANFSMTPRFLTARQVDLVAPLRFDRPLAQACAVELSVLSALGLESLDFRRF